MKKKIYWLDAMAFLLLSHMLLHDGRQFGWLNDIMAFAGLLSIIISFGYIVVYWRTPNED